MDEKRAEELNKEETSLKKQDVSPVETEEAEAAQPENEAFDETDYDAILNDGWADDVELHYPEPASGAEGDAGSDSAAAKDLPSAEDPKKDRESPEEEHPTVSGRSPRKKHGFRLFMLLWLGSIIVLLTFGLSYFYDFLNHYEESYPSSLPEREMDRIIELLASSDIDDIYRLATTPPPVAEGRTENDTKKALMHLLNDQSLCYRVLTVSERHQRDYEILVQDKAIGKATLVISPVDTLEYGLPLWYLSSLEFYAVETPGSEEE
ncbi:MAG: hypothetical protein IKO11_07855 [Lachnospiraceae bacterium]|nr:hypothetical protein [Lachnospiraceae bacterium]